MKKVYYYVTFITESEPDGLDTSGQTAATRAANTTAAAAHLTNKTRPLRPAFEIQHNTETDGGSETERTIPAFVSTAGAFRIIEVSAASNVTPQLNAEIKVVYIYFLAVQLHIIIHYYDI